MKQIRNNRIFVHQLLAFVIAAGLVACDKNDLEEDNGGQPPNGAGASVMAAAGDSATIVGTVNEFRKLLGNALNTTPGKQGGRREINWDAVPAAFTNKPGFPLAFFNSTSATDGPGRKRGLLMADNGSQFSVDTTQFAGIEPSYAGQFETFSRNRLFANLSGTVSEAVFKVPGTDTSAAISGFGVVFSDVDSDHSTTVEYFNGDKSLGIFKVPAHPAGGSFSFLGVYFNKGKITRVKITAGNGFIAPGVKDLSNGGSKDLVVMDDFLYNEPAAK